MTDTPCEFCRHPFDQDAAGLYGCPNCHGEGLEERPKRRVVIVDGNRHSAAYLVAALAALGTKAMTAARPVEAVDIDAVTLHLTAALEPTPTIRYGLHEGPRTKADRKRNPKYPRRR